MTLRARKPSIHCFDVAQPDEEERLMNNDRYEQSGELLVDARSATASSNSRASQQTTRNPSFTREWSVFRTHLLSAFFRDVGALASRYRVSADDVLEHTQAHCAPQLERGNVLKPVACVGDLAVATACCLNRSNAWNELWIFAEPSMTRAAFSRLPETLSLTWTRRYWTQLSRETRNGGGLHRYDGSRPIRLWLVEELLTALEAERNAGRIEIRREHLGRPIPLRLVGHRLA